jgi:two-component system probable response regulator PhcQ
MAVSSRVVLIVAEKERTRAAFARCLANEPHRVLAAARISEALERMATESVDLVVSDTLLPDGPGQGFLRDVRHRFPDTMRILLTPIAGLGTAVESMERGEIYRFLVKPWDDVELRGVVRGALERLMRERENCRLLARVHREIHQAIAHAYPELHLIRDATGSILLDDTEGDDVALAVG